MRKNSWQDGVQGTNCPILPGKNWTYSFQIKDQIGSYFYFPSLLLQKAAGGYGAIRVYSPELVPVPFPRPDDEYDILIGDWFRSNHRVIFIFIFIQVLYMLICMGYILSNVVRWLIMV